MVTAASRVTAATPVTGRGFPVCRDRGTLRVRGFARGSVAAKEGPKRVLGMAGRGVWALCLCQVQLSSGMATFPQPIPALSQQGTGHCRHWGSSSLCRAPTKPWSPSLLLPVPVPTAWARIQR